ncbi:hypothetical protein KC337_g13 [Hortaea werneckii]|nr:hypothetical protein KC337_g13 [Hortaea werneckii]
MSMINMPVECAALQYLAVIHNHVVLADHYCPRQQFIFDASYPKSDLFVGWYFIFSSVGNEKVLSAPLATSVEPPRIVSPFWQPARSRYTKPLVLKASKARSFSASSLDSSFFNGKTLRCYNGCGIWVETVQRVVKRERTKGQVEAYVG